MVCVMIRCSALPLVIAVASAFSWPLAAQNAGEANDAASAAEQVAQRASGAFERIDPDQVLPAQDEAALTYAGLPPLAPEVAPEAPRLPAVREIAREALPAPVPAPVAVAAVAPLPNLAPTPVARANNDPFVINSILPIEGTIRYGDWFWDESAAPRAGKLVITVDLDARVISAFRDGHEIGTAVALLGTQKHPTPLGTFPILTKEKDNVSEKYDNAPMPHTLRLTWSGIAIHGSPVLNGYASHGCVGVPDEFAAKLFAAARRGDKVIITRGKMVGVGDKIL